MSAPKNLDRQIESFLADGPVELPEPSYAQVRDRIDHKRQRAAFGPWSNSLSNHNLVRYALAAAVVVVIALVGYRLFGGSQVGGPGPTETPKPSATAEPFAWFEPIRLPEPRTDLPRITVAIPAEGWKCAQVGYDACVLINGGGERSLSVADGRLPQSALLATFTRSGILVYDDACQWVYDLPDPPLTTADEIAAALAAQPGRDASDPVDVTVGGYPGTMVTLHVPADAGYAVGADGGWFTDCFRGFYASYTHGDHDAAGTLPLRWHQAPGQIDTFWIVEVDGAIVIIDAMYRADTPADRIEEMRAIAESATFEYDIPRP